MAALKQPLAEVARRHAADEVYDQLADAIVAGAWKPGTALPPERVLAERFGVSRFVVRQAVHRLGELGLVRVRQGELSTVLDPRAATDLRVLEIRYRRAPASRRVARDLIERQILLAHALVHVAMRRASRRDLLRLQALADQHARSESGDAEWDAFEERFWRALTVAGGNQLYLFDINWWYDFLRRRTVPRVTLKVTWAVRIGFLQQLTRALVTGEDAAAFYLQAMAPLLA